MTGVARPAHRRGAAPRARRGVAFGIAAWVAASGVAPCADGIAHEGPETAARVAAIGPAGPSVYRLVEDTWRAPYAAVRTRWTVKWLRLYEGDSDVAVPAGAASRVVWQASRAFTIPDHAESQTLYRAAPSPDATEIWIVQYWTGLGMAEKLRMHVRVDFVDVAAPSEADLDMLADEGLIPASRPQAPFARLERYVTAGETAASGVDVLCGENQLVVAVTYRSRAGTRYYALDLSTKKWSQWAVEATPLAPVEEPRKPILLPIPMVRQEEHQRAPQ